MRCVFPGSEIFEKMKEVLIDAKAAGERLLKDLLKISCKLEKNDEKSHTQVFLAQNSNVIFCM